MSSLSGQVERRFHCEFHSVLKELDAENTSWIAMESLDLTDYGEKRAQKIHDQLKSGFDTAFPDASLVLRKKILDNFCRDFVISNGMEAATSIHALYAPLLIERSSAQPAPGFAALQVVIPNLAHLHWEEILELREQECLVEFRQKLTSIEKAVRTALTNQIVDEVQYQLALAQTFSQELRQELANRQPKVGEAIGNVAFDFLFSLVPIPAFSSMMSAIKEGNKLDDARRSWVTAFLRLTKDM